MARIKLNIPEKFEFTTEIPISINNINYGGHLGNDSLLSLMHEARVRFFKKNNFTEKNIGGAGIIITDVAIVYKAEGFYGDILKFEIAREDFNKYGCDIVYKITNQDTGVEVARAKTGIVFFDYKGKKIVTTPDIFRKNSKSKKL